MQFTAKDMADLLVKLGYDRAPTYTACRAVAKNSGMIDGAGGRASYRLGNRARAACILLGSVRGSGLKANAGEFLNKIANSRALAAQKDLLELATDGEPEHLDESDFIIDGTGAMRWTYITSETADTIELDAVDYGGNPSGRTVTITGKVLREVLGY